MAPAIINVVRPFASQVRGGVRRYIALRGLLLLPGWSFLNTTAAKVRGHCQIIALIYGLRCPNL